MSAMEIPPRMMELALRRIGVLPAEERDTLGVLSIDADGATADLVAGCRDVSRLAALRVLQQLVGARGLVRHDGDRYVIAHAEIREAVYGELIPELRAAYHDHAATTLLESAEGAARPARLGRHLRLAGRKKEAVEPLLAAGRALLAGYSPAEGLDVLEEAIMCAGPGGCPAAEVERARALEMLGELERARTELVRLSDVDGEPGVAALMHLVAFERNRGHDDAASAALVRAFARECSSEQRCRLHLFEAELASRANRADAAMEALTKAEALSDGVSQGARLLLCLNGGVVRFRLDRFVDAKEWLLRALELSEQVGAQEYAVNAMANLSLVCDDLGSLDESIYWAERAVERAALVGADRQHVFASLHLATFLIDSVRLDEADVVLARITDELERLDSDEARYSRFARQAELALARGQFGVVLEAVDRGLTLASAHPRNQAGFWVLRAQAQLALRRHEEAYDDARRARSVFTALGADVDAEEALALAARAARQLGEIRQESEALRSIAEPRSFAGALERLLDSTDPMDRARWRQAAERLARHGRWKAELAAALV
jgi:tetratricopeptide (TPR) repeat protein